MGKARSQDILRALGERVQSNYVAKKRMMSFAEYLDLVCARPEAQLRSAPQYIRDCFDYFGSEDVEYPWGKVRRFRLFDCEWADGRERLVGQEEVHHCIYRALENQVSEGVSNKLLLLHGPNGSAKSTFVRCIGRAMQHYSLLDEGAVYRLNWIFPTEKVSRGGIGFAGDEAMSRGSIGETYAYLPDELVDAKLVDELRDHPILLIPGERRRMLIDESLGDKIASGDFVLSDYIRFGSLSHKNRAVYEALLTSYQGDYLKVLRHVQIERFYIRHRYREGYATVEPQLSVDASERQITADRSMAALPTALQSISLYEYNGPLVAANRGLIEYSDLLKRPLEAYKYLITTVERATVSLLNASLFLDVVFIGTTNEIHLAAFKETAEFQSFQGRIQLTRVPYLLDYKQESEIYDDKLREAAGTKHIAPHCATIAALWAVLTRMCKPGSDSYPEEIAKLINKLGPLEKVDLYATGCVPEGLGPHQARNLATQLPKIWRESHGFPNYEGCTGASPREMQVVLFNAANSDLYSYVSPLAILEEIAALCQQTSVYRFLQQDVLPGGYHDHQKFITLARNRLIDRVDGEVRQCLGLVDEDEYERFFNRYVNHVMHWTKKEQVRNEITGEFEQANEKMMAEVESVLGVDGNIEDFRRDFIGRIGAWSLDHPNQKPEYHEVFAQHFGRLRNSYFEERKKLVAKEITELVNVLASGDGEEGRAAKHLCRALEALITRFGYTADSARDLVSLLYRERYASLDD